MPNDGTIVGSACNYAAGEFSSCIQGFVYPTDYVLLPADLFAFGASANWTIELWVKVAGTVLSVAISSDGTGGGSDNAIWIGVLVSGNAAVSVNGTGGFASLLLDTGIAINDDTWHHVAMVMTGGTALATFVDGVAGATATGVFSPPPGGKVVGIGLLNGVGFAWPGQVDEIAIWATTAKYTTGFTPPVAAYTGAESGLTALYHLNGDVTDSAAGIYTRVDTTAPAFGQNCMILVPSALSAVPYNAGNPTPLVIYHHGVGETETALVSDSLKAAVVAALINAGYILAGTNAHGENWGSTAGCDDYWDLYLKCITDYNVSKVLFLSQSMGGLTGLLSLTRQDIPNVVGWCGIYPVCNLANLHTLGGSFGTAIETAYGITGVGTQTYANKAFAHDPVLKTGASFQGVWTRFYASASDTVVPKADNTDVLAALVAGSVAENTVVVCTGNHGDPSHFQPSDVVAFFARALLNPPSTTGRIGSGSAGSAS
jgi:hypothetical protein